MVKVVNFPLPAAKQSLKATYPMVPKGITIHNTYNDAPARKEISYMQSNNNSVSFHVAVDDKEAIQGVPFNRNTWHAGDGGNGYGNRNQISVEICYSKSGGAKYVKAEDNTAKYVAKLLHERGWGINKVKKHQDWSGKFCPHRVLSTKGGWTSLLSKIKKELDALKGSPSKPVTPSVPSTPNVPPSTSKSIDKLAKEVIDGKHGTGETRKKSLGSNYSAVQKRVNEILSGKQTNTPSAPQVNKSIDQLAKEVMAGKHGTGETRRKSLGKDYDKVQSRVNELLKGYKENPRAKTVSELADEVMKGLHGSGRDRMNSLGDKYAEVQKEVNRRMRQ